MDSAQKLDVILEQLKGVSETKPADARMLDPSYYHSNELFELEKEHVWRQVWQMACREEHVPVVGDTYVYDICDMSFVIVRSDENTIRAFWYVCNHRGRQLVSQPGRMKVLRCPFHGFSWNE